MVRALHAGGPSHAGRYGAALLAGLALSQGLACRFDTGGLAPADLGDPDRARFEDAPRDGARDRPAPADARDGRGVDGAAIDARADQISLDAKPEAGKLDGKSDTLVKLDAKPDAAKPDAVKPDAVKPDAMKPDAAKPDAAKPDAGKPDQTCADLALSFDGVDDLVVVPSNAALEPTDNFTISAWIKPAAPTTVAGEQVIVSSVGLFKGYALRLTAAGSPVFVVFHPLGVLCECASTAVLPVGAWAHVAGSFLAGTARIFLDGQPKSCSCPGLTVEPSSGSFVIGASSPAIPGLRFPGIIDDVKLETGAWTGAIDPRTTGVSCGASTVAAFRFSEGSGQSTSSSCSAASYAGKLGLLTISDPSDPAWVITECVGQR